VYITIDDTDERPFYRQIVDEIKGLIACGELSEGTSLPPVRQVAADLGVNLNNIAVAYRALQKEGLIRVKHGAGAVVASRTLNETTTERLRTQLRAALTQMVLAGLTRAEMKTLIEAELDQLRARRDR
jgi:GntR family transcriptional regulator